MGPLFAVLLVAPIALFAALLIFLVSRSFLPSNGAIRMAIALPLCGGAGFIVGGILISPFFLSTLNSTAQVLTMLGFSCAVGATASWAAGWIIYRLYR